MAAPALLCAAIEVALNRYLRLEPAAIADCARLAGRRIGLSLADLGWTFVIEFNEGGVRVDADTEIASDVSVRAASPRLLALALRAASGEAMPLAGLQIDGDAELLQRFTVLLKRVGLDVEELLAPLLAPFGEGAAHRVAGGIRAVLGWGSFAAGRIEQNTAEYLQHETRDLAQAADVEDWMNAVETARERVDRAEAKLAALERSLRSAADAPARSNAETFSKVP